MKLGELNIGENKKVLAYGLSGSGKTVFACGFPGPLWVADFDGKVSSAAAYYRGTPQIEKIEYDRFSGKGDFNNFWKRYLELRQARPEAFPYKTIVIDSITTFAASLMAEVMRQNPGDESKRGKVSDTTVPHLRDYQIAISHIKNTVTGLLSLPCNVVMTAHIQTEKDELTGEIHRQPMIFGKDLPGWLPMVFEEVYYCSVQSIDGNRAKHVAQARGPKYVCRTQIPKLPAVFDLNYEALKQAMEAK